MSALLSCSTDAGRQDDAAGYATLGSFVREQSHDAHAAIESERGERRS